MGRPSKYIDMTGQVFGRLTVLERVGTLRGSATWLCKCSCGKEKVTTRVSLTTGCVVSCGCRNDEIRKSKDWHIKVKDLRGQILGRLLPKGEAGLIVLYAQYKANARQRNREFTLDRDRFRDLTSSLCHYCGVPPLSKSPRTTLKKGQTPEAFVNSIYLFNGVDRVDNSKGYVQGNVVPCCTICNLAKRGLSSEDFLTWVKRLCTHQWKSAVLQEVFDSTTFSSRGSVKCFYMSDQDSPFPPNIKVVRRARPMYRDVIEVQDKHGNWVKAEVTERDEFCFRAQIIGQSGWLSKGTWFYGEDSWRWVWPEKTEEVPE